jgi:uncharacterized protein (TIGR02246 family)
MSRTELRAIVDHYLNGWATRQPEAIACHFDADGVAESPMYSTLRGRQAIEDAARALFTSFPDWTQRVEAIIIDPPQAAVFTTANATHVNEFFGFPGTGRRFELRNSRLIRMNDEGLIAHEWRVYDFTGLLVQVGVLRAKPAKP